MNTLSSATITDHHGILLSFGATIHCTFPLILIIGREPNTKHPIANVLDCYDFQLHPLCGLWNTSYSTVARINTMSIRQLKKLCIQKQSSPIIYADALPIGLKNRVVNKYD